MANFCNSGLKADYVIFIQTSEVIFQELSVLKLVIIVISSN